MTKTVPFAVIALGLAPMLAGCGSRANPGATNPLILPPVYGTPANPAKISDGICRNLSLDRFKGQVANTATAAQMLAVSGARTIRWVQPGQVVTMDFNPQRLTAHLATGLRVERANCG